jgi:7-cyano-7-deazaguanine synthase in queuosine biosynthesis
MAENRVLLFSGGLDSFIAYHYLGHHIKTVYFNTGIKYSDEEERVIKHLIPDTIIDHSLKLKSREIENSDTAFIPMRNLYLAMLACKYGDEIIIAGLKDDAVNDKNPQIFEKMSAILSELNGRKIVVRSPFWEMTKADIVKWYLAGGGNQHDLLKTISCYEPDKTDYCGKCKCCFRKWVALWVNGIKLEFHNEQLIREYYDKAILGLYVQQRNENIIKAVKEYGRKLQVAAVEKMKVVYYVDIDGILTKEIEGHEYHKRTPNHENIAKINKLHREGNKIVLWTSRYLEDKEVTKKWLLLYDVRYDELILGKPQYDFIIDDKTKLVEEL